MREIEILVKVLDTKEKAFEVLSQFKNIGINKTIDIYYYDKLRATLKPNEKLELKECFRLRQKNDMAYITYKVDKFDKNGKWLYSDEYETKIESLDILKSILGKLGFEELITIDNCKYTYEYNKYEIVLEEVKDLGLFLEVEYTAEDTEDFTKIKENIQGFINSLDICVTEEINVGKPELMLKKRSNEKWLNFI